MRILAFIAVLIAVPAAATEVYRWVDETGQAHYSDQWQPGAEKVRIEESSGFSSPKPAQAGAAEASGQKPAQAGGGYQSLAITSPAQEEVLWNIEGQLRVSLQVNPALQPGHDLRLYLDGTPQELPAGSTEAQLKDVFRGVHTLKAAVVNQSGQVLIASQPTTFAVRQTSLANPSRPIRP
jgi:hypothetical protein